MKKIAFLGCVSLVVLSAVLNGCSNTSSPNSASIDDAVKLAYNIEVDEKFKKTEQREVRVTTEETDFEGITEDIKSKYAEQNLDSLHLYIHEPSDTSSFGELMAHSFIAYTQKGAAQVGLTEQDSYKIETKN